jgi:hypothetical protein
MDRAGQCSQGQRRDALQPRHRDRLRLQLDVLNLFNAKTNQIEYYYLSRLPGEPIDGVADRHVHPAEPLAVCLTLAGRF